MLYLQEATFRARPLLVEFTGVMSAGLLAVNHGLHGTKRNRDILVRDPAEPPSNSPTLVTAMLKTFMPTIANLARGRDNGSSTYMKQTLHPNVVYGARDKESE